MGCDIHCYIEFRRDSQERWDHFGGNINPGRNYNIFARLADVRNYEEIQPVTEERGFPSDAAWPASSDNYLYISTEEGEGNVNPEVAAQWVKAGYSYYHKVKWVSNPDWHSHSWLTLKEFEQAISGFPDALEYQAIAAAMRLFQEKGCFTRLVFWFDN